VWFAHGSGSSRHSPRNRYVAAVLNQAALGTLLFDLLTPDEEADRANVFDIELLTRRLTCVTRWLRDQPGAAGLPVGYFGASTGAAAALGAAAEPGADIAAVVSRGGRPDLASPRLGSVRAPTLLIVGGRDDVVLGLNRQAQAQLRCENELAVVPAPPTCSRSQALSPPPRSWRVTGSPGTSYPVPTRSPDKPARIRACHGAGRVMNRHQAARAVAGAQLRRQLEGAVVEHHRVSSPRRPRRRRRT